MENIPDIVFGRSKNKSVRDHGRQRTMTWLGSFDFEWSLGGSSIEYYGVVQPQSGRVFTLFLNRGRNMDPQQHTGDAAENKTVGSSGQIGATEGRSE